MCLHKHTPAHTLAFMTCPHSYLSHLPSCPCRGPGSQPACEVAQAQAGGLTTGFSEQPVGGRMTHFFKRHLTEGSICSEIDGLLLQSIFNCGSAVGGVEFGDGFPRPPRPPAGGPLRARTPAIQLRGQGHPGPVGSWVSRPCRVPAPARIGRPHLSHRHLRSDVSAADTCPSAETRLQVGTFKPINSPVAVGQSR